MYWVGHLSLAELRAVMEVQTGCSVIVRGSLWQVIQNDTDTVPVRRRRSGPGVPVDLLDRESATLEWNIDEVVAGTSMLRVSVVVVDVSGSVVFPNPAVTVDAAVAKISSPCLDGGDVDIRQTEQRSIPAYTVPTSAGSAAGEVGKIQTGLIQVEAGLSLNCHVRSVGAKLHVEGSFELSKFSDSGLSKTQSRIVINSVMRRGEKVYLGEVDRADVSVRLAKTWGLNGGAGHLRIYLLVE